MSEQRPAKPGGTKRRLARIDLERATELIALVAASAAGLHTLFYGLGLLTHTSREQLLGLGAPLTYPTQSALLTSLNILWSVPLHSLWAPVSGEIWVLAVLVPLLPLALVRRPDAPARRVVAAHAGCLLLLLVALRFYQAALFPHLQPSQVAPHFTTAASPAWLSQVEQHAISWLVNEHPRHPGRRKALAGIAGWLLAVTGSSAWLAGRQQSLRRGVRRALVTGHLLFVPAILGMVPRAHVIATWGLSYPRVQLREAESCDAVLRQALAGRCCAFDVSAGGAPRTTLQVGEACPGGTGFRTWSEEEARCFLLGAREIISDGCS